MNEPWELPTALARKARELTEGMRARVKRDPDIADYRAAFLVILKDAYRGHRLLGLHCNEHHQLDAATCECGWNSPWVESVGGAFDAWFDHVNTKKSLDNG